MYKSGETRQKINDLIQNHQNLFQDWEDSINHDQYYLNKLKPVVKSALCLNSYDSILKENSITDIDSLLTNNISYKELLNKLPIISKKEMRYISNDVLVNRKHLLSNYFETSGTTDSPVPAPKSIDDLVLNTVNFGEHWANFINNMDVALILINTPQGPAAFQFEQVFKYLEVMTFRTWVDTVRNDYARVLDIIDKIKPTIYAGPPSQLINLYECASKINKYPIFKKILLTGERASPALKERIEKLTGGIVYDASYGSSETGTTAIAISPSALKLQTQSYLFEVMDEKGQVHLVEDNMSIEGELVVTSLDIVNRPLIRYKTGDRVRIVSQYNMQVLIPLGRISDTFKLHDNEFQQDQFEALFWSNQSSSKIFNYLLAYNKHDVYFVFTGDYLNQYEAELDLAAMKNMIKGIKLFLVTKLPDVIGLGSTLGWKAARIHNLDDIENKQFPEHIRKGRLLVQEFVQSLNKE